jgi:hypothetical protein
VVGSHRSLQLFLAQLRVAQHFKYGLAAET